jgi:hypothetical protein
MVFFSDLPFVSLLLMHALVVYLFRMEDSVGKFLYLNFSSGLSFCYSVGGQVLKIVPFGQVILLETQFWETLFL